VRVPLVFCVTLLATNVAYADQGNTAEILAEPNQAVVQVNGIVCSFCAYGTEKNLSKLRFLNDAQFGGDGVLVDIQLHRITLALQPDQELDLAQVYNAIKKGGYDPVSFHVNVHGQVQKDGDRYFLTSPDSGQVFEIIGDDAERLVDRGLVHVKGQVDVEHAEAFKADQPLAVVMTSNTSN